MDILAKLMWLVTCVCCALGVYMLWFTFANGAGAPQEAAGAAVACAFAVIPYVLTRAIEGLGKRGT